MHSNPHSGSSERVVPAGHSGVGPDTLEGEGNAKGLRIEEDERRGHTDPASSGQSGDDTGGRRSGGHQQDLFGPAVEHGGSGDDGRRSGDTEPASVRPKRSEDEVSEVTIFRIPASQLYEALKLGADVGLDPIIEETADETPRDVGLKLQTEQAQFWSVGKDGKFVGSIITELQPKADGLVLVVKYMAGKTFKDWLDVLHNTMVDFAKHNGCIAIETHSREALRKPLINLGWSKVAVLYRVPIDG